MVNGDVAPPRDREAPRRSLLALVVVAVVAAFAGVIALQFVSATGDVGPGRMQISAHWSRSGDTELEFPPLGRIGAPTHSTPIAVSARVEALDVEAVEGLIQRPKPGQQLQAAVEREFEEGHGGLRIGGGYSNTAAAAQKETAGHGPGGR